jgi:hypothetical protein
LHIDHLRAARITHRSAIANHQHGAVIHAQFRIVEPRVIILGPFEHDRLAFEHVRMSRVRQEAFAEGLIDHADLHHRAVEQIARQHDVTGGFPQGLVVGPDHFAVGLLQGGQIFLQRTARDGAHAAVQLAGCQQFAHHGRHAAGTMECLT